jgi:hypothetical protein
MEVHTMSGNNSLVATYVNHSLAESTVKKLHEAGFDMNKLSIVGKNLQKATEMAGATVLGNLGVLDAAQYTCIPRERVPDYEAELNDDRMLIVMHGTPDEIDQAKHIIDSTHPESWNGKVSCAVYYGCVD